MTVIVRIQLIYINIAATRKSLHYNVQVSIGFQLDSNRYLIKGRQDDQIANTNQAQ